MLAGNLSAAFGNGLEEQLAPSVVVRAAFE